MEKNFISKLKPRGYFFTAVIIASFSSIPFGIGWTLYESISKNISIYEATPYGIFAGAFFGFFFSIIMSFSLKGHKKTIKFVNFKSFSFKLNVLAAKIGFTLDATHDGIFIFKPSIFTGFLAGKLIVICDEDNATFIGAKIYVNKLISELNE